jgi:hypothetical protein
VARRRKNPAAVALGRRGGAAQVPKGFARMSKTAARQIQRAGGYARGIPALCRICGEELPSGRQARMHCLGPPAPRSWRD